MIMKLRNFCFYTMTFKSACANVMVGCYSFEHGVQDTKPYFRAAHAARVVFFKTGSTCIEPHDCPMR